MTNQLFTGAQMEPMFTSKSKNAKYVKLQQLEVIILVHVRLSVLSWNRNPRIPWVRREKVRISVISLV